jgi:hypothetical protein
MSGKYTLRRRKKMSDVRQINSDEMFCTHCGAIIRKEAEICPKCGCRVAPVPSSVKNTNDGSSFGYGFLGFLIPLLGLILFIVWKSNYPLKAKSCGIGALIGFIIGIVFSVIFFIITTAAVAGSLLNF